MRKLKSKICTILSFVYLFTLTPSITFAETNANDVNEEMSLERALIPKPLSNYQTEGKFILTENTSIYVQGNTEEETDEIFRTGEYISNKFRPSTGFPFNVVKGDNVPDGNIYLTTVGGEEEQGNEGYKISVTTKGVEVVAYKPEGIFRAVQTLRQLLPASIEKSKVVTGEEWSMPCSEIDDKPEYEYRGTMLDTARHFFSVDQVKRYIDNAVQYKINKLHFHLSDDQGWRLQIKGTIGEEQEDLNKLVEIGAQSSVYGDKGGYYTQEEFKEIVEYANERYVEVIPEFDMPGHTWAALVSLNYLNSTPDGKPVGPKDNTKPTKDYDVGFSTFECNNENTYEFVDTVFKQISEISPLIKTIHVGGDEAHSTSKEDYNKFCQRVTEIAHNYNMTTIGWQAYDEVVTGDENAICQYWSNGAANGNNFKGDLKQLVSPANKSYIDQKYDRSTELGLSWAGPTSVQQAYEWDPTDYGAKDRIIGIEAAMFSETIRESKTENLEFLAFPRILGLAEIGWTPKEVRSWKEYKPRLVAHGERLENQGINYFKDPKVWEAPYEPVNAEWNMDEAEGTVINDKNALYPGTIKGGTTWVEGKNGSALSFDGTGYVDLGINDLKGDWSATLWVNKGQNTGTNAVLIGGDEGEIKLEQWKNTQKVGITQFGVGDNTFNYVAPEGEWVHLSFVGDGTGTALYVNGQLQDKISAKINGPAKRIGANVKAGLADSGNMKGSLDEVKIFNRALTAEEIAAIVEGGEEVPSDLGFKVTLPADEITVKNNFDVKVGAKNLDSNNMYSMQFDVAYDKEKVDFANATSIDDSKYIVSAKDKDGTVTVVVATKGEAIVNDEDIVNLEFTAKAAGENIKFNITNGQMADEDGNVVDMADEAATLTIVEGEIEPEPGVDKTALKIAIDYADEIVADGGLEGVVPAVVKEFNESLAEAKEVYGNKEATEVEVDAAFKRLVNSIWMLEFKQGNKEALQALVDSAKALVEKEYTSDSWANLQKVLEEVEGVLADENAMQKEIDEALNNLKTAINDLVKKNIDKTALENFVNKVKDLDKKSYINSTWKNFDKALKDAEKVLRNEDATQEEVDSAYNNLVKAYLDLRLIPDKSALEDLINKVKNMDLSKYTKESVAMFNKELKNASKVLKDKEATQQEVDSATKTLELALTNLEEKEKTNKPDNNNGNNNSGNNKQNESNGKGGKLPSTGAVVSSSLILLLGVGAVVAGGVTLKKRKREE